MTLKEKIVDFAQRHGSIRACDVCTYFKTTPGIANATLNYLREKEIMKSIPIRGKNMSVWVVNPPADAKCWRIPDTQGLELERRASYY